MADWEIVISIVPFLLAFFLVYLGNSLRRRTDESFNQELGLDTDLFPIRFEIIRYLLYVVAFGMSLFGVSTLRPILDQNTISDTLLLNTASKVTAFSALSFYAFIVIMILFTIMSIITAIAIRSMKQAEEKEKKDEEI